MGGWRGSCFFRFDRSEAKNLRVLSDSTLVLNSSKQGKVKISFRSAFEATYPGVKILSFDVSSAAKAQELAALLAGIVQEEWAKGADGMFDENDIIDCTLVIYWSNNDGAKQAGKMKKCPTGCIDAYTPEKQIPTRCLFRLRHARNLATRFEIRRVVSRAHCHRPRQAWAPDIQLGAHVRLHGETRRLALRQRNQ